MHDPKAYTLVPAANTVMRQGYVILHDVSQHIVLGVAYSGPVGRPLSMDPARGTRVEWWAEVAAGKWVIVCHEANQCFYPVGMGHHCMPCIAVVHCAPATVKVPGSSRVPIRGTAVINTHSHPAVLGLIPKEEPGKTGRHPVLKYRFPHGSQHIPPLSPSPHTDNFIIGTAVINTHTVSSLVPWSPFCKF
jgi:hypothetical protein